jgi:hypothetical protein
MIGHLLNQFALHHAKASVNEYNEPTFSPPLTINVRFEQAQKLVKNEVGEDVLSEARLYSELPIAVGDKIEYDGREWIVISVKSSPDFNGIIHFWEVYL